MASIVIATELKAKIQQIIDLFLASAQTAIAQAQAKVNEATSARDTSKTWLAMAQSAMEHTAAAAAKSVLESVQKAARATRREYNKAERGHQKAQEALTRAQGELARVMQPVCLHYNMLRLLETTITEIRNRGYWTHYYALLLRDSAVIVLAIAKDPLQEIRATEAEVELLALAEAFVAETRAEHQRNVDYCDERDRILERYSASCAAAALAELDQRFGK